MITHIWHLRLLQLSSKRDFATRIVMLIFSSLLVSACTTVEFQENSGDRAVYFGFVVLRASETTGAAHIRRVKSLGVAVDTSFSVGWSDSFYIIIPEDDGARSGSMPCKLIILVESKEMLDTVLSVSDKLGDGLCIADL